jgi:hypothetical protein
MVWDEEGYAFMQEARVWLDAAGYPEFRDLPILTWAANAGFNRHLPQ